MSWFGDTFGDSLTSLKGQITKITKEVGRLVEDESFSEKKEVESKSENKSEEAQSQSEELESESSRKEFGELQSQYVSRIDVLENENEKCKSNSCDNDSLVGQITRLENELTQLKTERSHLNSCLDELQMEHQINLDEVISMKDKYKKELEELKESYNVVKLKLDEFSKNQNSASTSTDCKIELSEKDIEINSLRGEIEALYLKLNESEKEKEEARIALNSELAKNDNLKKELEKLLGDIKMLKEEKVKTENDNKSIKLESEKACKKVELMEKECSDVKVQIRNLVQEKEELLKKCEENTILNSSETNMTEAELKLKDILQKIDVNIEEEEGNGFNKFLALIEKHLVAFQNSKREINDKLKQVTESSEVEIKKMKELNGILQNEIKSHTEKWMEKEKKYQHDIMVANQNLEEATALKSKMLEMEKQEQIHNRSQTDDVKRLEQEVNKLLYLCEMKTDEINKLGKSKYDLEQELSSLKTACKVNNEMKKLEDEITVIKSREVQLSKEKVDLEEKLSSLEKENNLLRDKHLELEKEMLKNQSSNNEKMKDLEMECSKGQSVMIELQNSSAELRNRNDALKNEIESLMEELNHKTTNMTKIMDENADFQREIKRLQQQNTELHNSQEELQKWKNVSIDLEIKNQDLTSKIETLESELLKLNGNLELLGAKDSEITQLKEANTNLIESCNKLHCELETKIQSEQLFVAKENQLHAKLNQQEEMISKLQEENNGLKSEVQKFQEQIKFQVFQNQNTFKNDTVHQQHRRSKSDANFDGTPTINAIPQNDLETSEEVNMLKQALQNEQAKYRNLYNQFQEISEKEGSARREFERLKQHLIEVEDHYTNEAVENEKLINDLKLKLMTAEDQLKNSSTLYTSAKIRDNQHLESLQSQVRLISAQRDDFQAKLSATEDEIQKHKASLTSLQIVLEQFQQEKEQEVQAVAAKYDKKIKLTESHFNELEMEIDSLKKQLSEAKNGLKAASRLGEQLEKKTRQAMEYDQNLTALQSKVTELEAKLEISNQSTSNKVDKSLIKNLLMGYILSPKADRKSQVLRIMAAALDFDAEEREKTGVDATSSGWLANILHPKSGGPPSNESLSEAFIKFLENESRPQPQLNLLPAQYKATNPRPSSSSPKPHGVFSELMLPTFNSPEENESSVILKNVLRDNS